MEDDVVADIDVREAHGEQGLGKWRCDLGLPQLPSPLSYDIDAHRKDVIL